MKICDYGREVAFARVLGGGNKVHYSLIYTSWRSKMGRCGRTSYLFDVTLTAEVISKMCIWMSVAVPIISFVFVLEGWVTLYSGPGHYYEKLIRGSAVSPVTVFFESCL